MDVIRSRLIGIGDRGSAVDEAELLSQCDVVADDFDATYYAIQCPDVRGDLIQHFMSRGWREGKDPAPWFSTTFYLDANPDVAAVGLNPFYHYIRHGRAEGRPIAQAELRPDDRSWEIEAIRSGIEEAFYSQQLHGAGINPTGIDLALHYWREGVHLGLDPARDFSTSHYLEAHPDVVAAGVNPFAHYLAQGRAEGRSFKSPELDRAAEKEAVASPKKRGAKDNDRNLAHAGFDGEYYLSANPDVAAAGVDPLDHFLNSGWREGRNPNLWFSVAHYLDLYPDVAAAGINPFLHYLMAGKTEGRLPRHDLGFRYDIISSLQPLDEQIKQARAWSPSVKPSASEKLATALRGAQRLESKGLYLSVSHDDFTSNVGGVQLVLMRESAAVDRMGFDHLHLFPSNVISVVDFDTKNPALGVLLNRKFLGYFRASDIERELRSVSPRLRSRPFVIHSLIRHNADALSAILTAADCRSGWYWVHDYSSICTGYTLLRNDVEFCGGPPPTSTACSVCVYGSLRTRQLKAHETLFKKFDLTVLAPSEAALYVWKTSTSLVAPARVHEHLTIKVSKKASKKASIAERPLRVAYVGQAVSHKGWLAFRDLALKFGKDPRYEFYHVGKEPSPGVPVNFREVAVGIDDLDKMVRTLKELEIDAALLWSLWPETFCIAAAEALRAGASVLTFKDSGNVADLVKKTGFGCVLDSEEELDRLFETGDVIGIADRTRPSGLSATFSNMTADFIEAKVEGKAS